MQMNSCKYVFYLHMDIDLFFWFWFYFLNVNSTYLQNHENVAIFCSYLIC